MSMRNFSAYVIAVAVLGLSFITPAAASAIDGKWVSVRQVGDADGKTYEHTSTFELRERDGVLTGTVVQVSAAPWMKSLTGRTLELSEGKVEGDKFIFKLKMESAQGERTAIYEGTLDGDRLTGTTKYRGIGITEPFNATRAK